MIKIVKDGQTHFETRCDMCLCEFEYDLIDLRRDSKKYECIVECPRCRAKVPHENVAKYRQYKEELAKQREEITRLTLAQMQINQNLELMRQLNHER